MKPAFMGLLRALMLTMAVLPAACVEPQEPITDPAIPHEAAQEQAATVQEKSPVDVPEVFFWPAPGNACYQDCSTSPNCVWTCNNGSMGGSNVSSANGCRNACKAACGASTLCGLI